MATNDNLTGLNAPSNGSLLLNWLGNHLVNLANTVGGAVTPSNPQGVAPVVPAPDAPQPTPAASAAPATSTPATTAASQPAAPATSTAPTTSGTMPNQLALTPLAQRQAAAAAQMQYAQGVQNGTIPSRTSQGGPAFPQLTNFDTSGAPVSGSPLAAQIAAQNSPQALLAKQLGVDPSDITATRYGPDTVLGYTTDSIHDGAPGFTGKTGYFTNIAPQGSILPSVQPAAASATAPTAAPTGAATGGASAPSAPSVAASSAPSAGSVLGGLVPASTTLSGGSSSAFGSGGMVAPSGGSSAGGYGVSNGGYGMPNAANFLTPFLNGNAQQPVNNVPQTASMGTTQDALAKSFPDLLNKVTDMANTPVMGGFTDTFAALAARRRGQQALAQLATVAGQAESNAAMQRDRLIAEQSMNNAKLQQMTQEAQQRNALTAGMTLLQQQNLVQERQMAQQAALAKLGFEAPKLQADAAKAQAEAAGTQLNTAMLHQYLTNPTPQNAAMLSLAKTGNVYNPPGATLTKVMNRDGSESILATDRYGNVLNQGGPAQIQEQQHALQSLQTNPSGMYQSSTPGIVYFVDPTTRTMTSGTLQQYAAAYGGTPK